MDPDTLFTRLVGAMRRDGPGATRNPSSSHVPGEVVDSVLEVDCSTIGIAITATAGKGSLVITTKAARHILTEFLRGRIKYGGIAEAEDRRIQFGLGSLLGL